jgi:hypothetical protein
MCEGLTLADVVTLGKELFLFFAPPALCAAAAVVGAGGSGDAAGAESGCVCVRVHFGMNGSLLVNSTHRYAGKTQPALELQLSRSHPPSACIACLPRHWVARSDSLSAPTCVRTPPSTGAAGTSCESTRAQPASGARARRGSTLASCMPKTCAPARSTRTRRRPLSWRTEPAADAKSPCSWTRSSTRRSCRAAETSSRMATHSQKSSM